MATRIVQRCSQCRKDRKKCVMLNNAGSCERCKENGFACEDYAWPLPRHPPPVAENKESGTPSGEPRSSKTYVGHTISRRRKSSTRDRRDRNDDYSQSDNNPAYTQYPLILDPRSSSLSGNVPSLRYDSIPQMQSPFAAVPQQSPASVRYSGYNNIGVSLDPSFGNSVPQSTNWSYAPQFMSYQTNQGQGQEWYQPGQQDQRRDRSRQFQPY